MMEHDFFLAGSPTPRRVAGGEIDAAVGDPSPTFVTVAEVLRVETGDNATNQVSMRKEFW